jgi:invasion protein IalB
MRCTLTTAKVRGFALIAVLVAIASPSAAAPILATPQPSPVSGTGQQTKPAINQSSTLFYSHWAKVCQKNPKPLCFTEATGFRATGQAAVTLMLVEPEGDAVKFLRVTLPLAMQLPAGTRLAVDDNASITAPYILCDETGCMADYAVSSGLIEQLKGGQRLLIQAVDRDGKTLTFVIPLADFTMAYVGPATDFKTFAEQQTKLGRELSEKDKQK